MESNVNMVESSLEPEEIAYIGNDCNDLEVIKFFNQCKLMATPYPKLSNRLFPLHLKMAGATPSATLRNGCWPIVTNL